MKIALLSDIHGNRWALEAVLAHAEAQRVDAVWNLGDILSGPLDAAGTADRLMAMDALTIAGNHERQLLACGAGDSGRGAGLPSDEHAFRHTTERHRAWLRALPATARPRPDVLLCHGTPASDLAPLAETHEPGRGLRLATAAECGERLAAAEPARLVGCGHTHLPRVLQASDDALVVNPGSVGLQGYDYEEDGVTYYVDNGTPHASYAIVEEVHAATALRWQASLYRVPYDWEAAAALAARNGRPEWAHALRTGYALRSTR
jgi:predicted phosphodiesterase